MGKKIFVSYKYNDSNVFSLKGILDEIIEPTTVRDYVDELQRLLSYGDHISKGENDGEDLSGFKDSTIESKLRNKIYDSSITIVIISPNMKETNKSEAAQWIPWEVAYSLRESTRENGTSQTNAVLAVVLPDSNNSYDYYMRENCCSGCRCITFMTNNVFQILRDNMFNVKEPSYGNCSKGSIKFTGYHSYIYSVKWYDFKSNVDKYLEISTEINENISNYDIVKIVE